MTVGKGTLLQSFADRVVGRVLAKDAKTKNEVL